MDFAIKSQPELANEEANCVDADADADSDSDGGVDDADDADADDVDVVDADDVDVGVGVAADVDAVVPSSGLGPVPGLGPGPGLGPVPGLVLLSEVELIFELHQQVQGVLLVLCSQQTQEQFRMRLFLLTPSHLPQACLHHPRQPFSSGFHVASYLSALNSFVSYLSWDLLVFAYTKI